LILSGLGALGVVFGDIGTSPLNSAGCRGSTSSRHRRKATAKSTWELQQAQQQGCTANLDDVTYYVGHEHIMHREQGATLPVWQEEIFAAIERNASHVTDYFRLPSRQVVEIGARFRFKARSHTRQCAVAPWTWASRGRSLTRIKTIRNDGCNIREELSCHALVGEDS